MDLGIAITFISFGVVLLGLLFFICGVEIIKRKYDKKFKSH
jgi:Na+-transporting methylmalonyl-CoA/oxaloacetate decarboxylase gamma subunit